MKLIREHFPAIIFHNFRRGLSAQECIDKLKFLYGDKAPSFSTMKAREKTRSVKVLQKQPCVN